MDLCPDEDIDADELDLLCRFEISGELETRFRLRGCNGDMGIESERRRALRAEAFTRSLEESFFRVAGALIASVRALSVALMTSVASIDLSFADSCSPSPCLFSWSAHSTFPLGFAGGAFTLFPLAAAVGFDVDFAIDFEAVGSGIIDFGNKRSESMVAVVGVQVDVELTAARIESAVPCKEVITIQKNTLPCYSRLYIIQNLSRQVVRAKKQ